MDIKALFRSIVSKAGKGLSAEEEAAMRASPELRKALGNFLPSGEKAAEDVAAQGAAPAQKLLNPAVSEAVPAAEQAAAQSVPAPVMGLKDKLMGRAPYVAAGIGAVGAMNAGAPSQPAPAMQPAAMQPQAMAQAPAPAAAAPEKPKPEDKGGLDPSVIAGFRRMQEELRKGSDMTAGEKKQLEAKNDAATNKLASLRDIYQKEMAGARSDSERKQAINAWAEIGETFGNAMAQLGAAETARKGHLNSPDVRLAKADWNSKYDQILKGLELRQREALQSAEMGERPLAAEQKNISSQIENLDRRGEKLKELQATLKEKEMGLAQGSVEKARERGGAMERTQENVQGKKDVAEAKAGAAEGKADTKSAEQQRKEEMNFNSNLNQLGQFTGKNKAGLPKALGSLSAYLVGRGVPQADIDKAVAESKGMGSMDAKDQGELKQKFVAMLQRSKAAGAGNPSPNLAAAKALQPRLISRAQLQSVMQKMGGVSEQDAKNSILEKLPNAQFE